MSNEQLKFLSDSEFKEAAKKGQTEGTGVRKGHAPEVKVVDESRRIVDFIISTEAVDRMGDVIRASGWQLQNFKENPVVLFGHDHSSPPIGRAIEIRKRPKKRTLEAKAEFASKEISPFADMIFQMFVNGFMRATSVGFMPLKFEFSQDEERDMGIDFLEQDLLEFSAVSVPANPEALMGARSKGIDMSPLKQWAEETLDEYEKHQKSGLIIPRKTVEQLRAKADTKQRKTFSLDSERARELAKQNLESIERQSKQSTDDIMVDKGAISFESAHAEGTPKAPRDEEWDGPAAVSEADIDDLQTMSAWRKDEPSGEDDEFNKADFKLPHHRANGEHAVVWRAVANAAARLPQTDVPEADVSGIQDHLGKHYREFDETPPWEDQEESWEAYVSASIKFLDDYKRGLVDSTEDLIALRDAGLEVFEEETMKSVIAELEDRYSIEKAEIDWPSKSVDDEDETIEIDNTPEIDDEVTKDVDKDSESGEEDLASEEDDQELVHQDKELDNEDDERREVDDEDSEEDPEVEKDLEDQDSIEVGESLLEIMETALDAVEQGDIDVKEFLTTRRGRRLLKNIVEVSKDFSVELQKAIEPEDTSFEAQNKQADNDEEKYIEVIDDDEDDQIEFDISDDELKALVVEEIGKITKEEYEKKEKEIKGIVD